MKISTINAEDIMNYLRIAESDRDINLKNDIENYLKIAKKFIQDETGLDAEEIDEHDDLIIIVYVLCQEFYDNRSLYVDEKNLNKVYETEVLICYASVKTTKGILLIKNDTDFEKAYTNFTIRYPRNVEITRDMFIRYNNKEYTIEYLNNVNEENIELEIQAKVVVK